MVEIGRVWYYMYISGYRKSTVSQSSSIVMVMNEKSCVCLRLTVNGCRNKTCAVWT
jgi:hypothetical protein